MQNLVDIVLSSFNGEEYIVEQLDSLLKQTARFQSVRIVDDASTDGTFGLVSQYINCHGTSACTVSANECNHGWQRNFHDLIVSSNADFIFPCDQDDIWHPCKLEYMLQVMEAHPEIDVLACSVEPFYENGAQRTAADTTESDCDVLGSVRLCEFNEKSLYVSRPGCTYCIRRSFVEEVKPYWNSEWPHDEFLWMMAGVKGSLGLLDKNLVRFRRHANNASRRRSVDRTSRIAEMEHYLAMIDTMSDFSLGLSGSTVNTQATLKTMRKWITARRRFLKGDGGTASLLQIVQHREFYATRKGLLVDVLVGAFGIRLE